MDFSHLLRSSLPQSEKLLKYGFSQTNGFYTKKISLNNDFYTIVTITTTLVTAEVFESENNEKYVLVDVPSANGTFVGKIREMVGIAIKAIQENCFYNVDLKTEYVEWLENTIGVKGEYPWEDDNTSAVYRCTNNKWFALVMKIKFKNLGFTSDEPVWVVNLKADADNIPKLLDNKSIFPAWHMNKKYWITVVLTAVTDFEVLQNLTVRSKELVEKK